MNDEYWQKEFRKQLLADAKRLRAEGKLGLRVGGYYLNASGVTHGPIKIYKPTMNRFVDEYGNWYGADGHYWQQAPTCPHRLVAELVVKDGKLVRV